MKLSIEKLPTGKLKLTLATATDKKPLSLELMPEQISTLLTLIQAASSSSVFNFTLHI
ncbi:MAG TPA: hypothetical protein VG269_26665 [Tepidisphaeraceae bacterium]|jgi:hypothetical protein|nr:hypothetical protein [Tepidisphaeraceae bacterium]